MIINKSKAYDGFNCLGGSCPDSCCKEWSVEVDGDSARRYLKLAGSLGDRLREVLSEEDGAFTFIPDNGRCPMWRDDGLCRIQAELGEKALCETCSKFPRICHEYDGYSELALELSCPEAARLILSGHQMQTMSEADCLLAGEPLSFYLRHRETLREILRQDRQPVPQRLALCLMYAYYAEALQAGEEEGCFDAEAELACAESFADNADADELLAFFRGLEILSPEWALRLNKPDGGAWKQEHIYLAEYFLDRYFIQALSDGDIVSRVKLMIISCIAVKSLGGNLIMTAQRFSKEIENNIDNLDAILDAAYTYRGFTDNKLLGLLLK